MTTDEVKTELDNELDELRHMAALLASPITDVIVRAPGGEDVFYVLEADAATFDIDKPTRDVTKPDDKHAMHEMLSTINARVTAHGYKVRCYRSVSALSWYLRHGVTET